MAVSPSAVGIDMHSPQPSTHAVQAQSPSRLTRWRHIGGVLLAWWCLFTPVIWMWPAQRSLLESVVSAAMLAPLFLWRRLAQAGAVLLVFVGLAHLAYFYAVGSAPDEFFWFTVLSTQVQESMDYVASYRWRDAARLLAWLIVAGGATVYLLRHARPLRSRGLRAVLWAIACIWLAWFSVAAYKGEDAVATWRKINRIYPVGLAEAYARKTVVGDQVFAVPEVAAPLRAPKADVVVVVIGESASAQRWSLLHSLENDTNAPLRPYLPGLHVLPVMSNGNNTAQTVPVLLTGDSAGAAAAGAQGTATYLDWARKAGFSVATFSNQGASGAAESFFQTAFRQRSDVFGNLQGGQWDQALTAPLQEALAQSAGASAKPLLVSLHTYGSHPRAGKRYPPDMAQWEDVYDNSIAYSSHLLAQWIGMLDALQGRRVLLMYISDHGVNFPACGGQYVHGSARSAFEVPMLLWANERFRADNEVWWQQAGAHTAPQPQGLPQYDNRVFAASLADVLGYALDYPSLGAKDLPQEPLLAGKPFRQRAAGQACDVFENHGDSP